MIYGTRKSSPREFIFSRISPYDIYHYYNGPFDIGQPVCNRLRNENNPSMVIREEGVELLHFDNGDSFYRGSCVNFVMQKYHCNYGTALKWIMKDFGLSEEEPERRSDVITWKQPVGGTVRHPPKFHIVTRAFTGAELQWWSDRLIGFEDLKREHIYAPRTIYRNLAKMALGDLMTFCYYYPELDKWKIYRPNAPRKEKDTFVNQWKWDSNLPHQTIENLGVVRLARRGLLTGKKKDRCFLMNLLETDAICNVQAEDPSCISNETLEALGSIPHRWGNGDDDDKGHQFTTFLQEHAFQTINGDMVDLYLEKGGDYVKELFNRLGWNS